MDNDTIVYFTKLKGSVVDDGQPSAMDSGNVYQPDHVHHNFCPTNSPKPKVSSFTLMNDKEKQQILWFEELELSAYDDMGLKAH